MKFHRSIGSVGLLLSAVGGIVGSGWLFGPLYAAQVAGPAAILSWIIGGILMIIIGFTFAELAAAFPVAGGMVHFAELSHGPLMSFTIGWTVWLSSVVVAPVETLALVQYAANYIPGLVVPADQSHVLTAKGIIASAIVMFIMCYFNFYGAKFFSRFSTGMVFIKLIVPILTVITLLSIDFHPSNFQIAGGFMPYGWEGVMAALPLGGIIFSFIGYSPAIQMAGEAKNPQYAIPLAILGSLVCCMVLYFMLQFAFVGALPHEFLSQGWSKLHFSNDNGPFAGILLSLGAIWLVFIIYIDAIVSPFGTGFIYTGSTARVNYAMSQVGIFPHFMQHLNKRGVPMKAVMANFVIGLILFLPFPGWQSMVSFIISCFVISYSIGPIALITLRRSYADHPRPFKMPYAELIAPLAFYICNLLIYWTGWQTVSRLLIALAIGLAIFVIRYPKLKSQQPNLHISRAFWLIVYFVGLGVLSYLGSFGQGKSILTFGADFIVIAIFSIFIYLLAIRSARRDI